MDFAVPANHRLKLKESEKKDKCLELAKKLKKLWKMKMTLILIVNGAFGTVTKGLIQGLEEIIGRVETIQTIEIGQNTQSWRFKEPSGHTNSCERPSANADVKKLIRSKL